jgi:GTP-binding protein
MLIDEATITVKAGNGGNGLVSFRREKFVPKGGPSGGDGGKGGDVYFVGVNDISALRQFRYKKLFCAQNGQNGQRDKKTGQSGKDLVLKLPVGSVICESKTGWAYDITFEGETICIVKGGRGGKGNWHFATSTNQIPQFAEHGMVGQEKNLALELRLIADIGLVGLPNAGKTSLLNELTNAEARVASYPFTTLEPNLGVMDNHIIADIPGLIEGASYGKGLGDKFLRHIQRTKIIAHCLSAESNDVINDYQIVRSELKNFNQELLRKKEVILLTKTDLIGESEKKKKLTLLKKINKEIILISIYDWDSLENIRICFAKLLHGTK